MKEIKFRDLLSTEIDLRVGATTDKGFTLLLYKDARVDMNILDETVGQFNWVKEFYQVKNTLMCRVGINVNYDNDKDPLFINKCDAGDESNTEAIKGEASDSFKRACFNWGIGRKLYTSPFVWINKDENNDPKKSHYIVKEIEYNDKEITKLVIVNEKTKQVAYSYGAKPIVSNNAVRNENNGTQPQESNRTKYITIIQAHEKFYQPQRFKEWLKRMTGSEEYESLSDDKLRIVAQALEKNNK